MMVGIWRSYTEIFIYINTTALLLAFCIPMMIAPMKWAKVLRWHIPDHEHLAIYLGRSLGGFACVLALFAFKAMKDSRVLPFYFDMGLGIGIAMIVIHAYGGIRKIQPVTETVEILFWIGQVVLTLCFYPGTQIFL
jgi:hypothetical protein